jgi:hypothetical protein
MRPSFRGPQPSSKSCSADLTTTGASGRKQSIACRSSFTFASFSYGLHAPDALSLAHWGTGALSGIADEARDCCGSKAGTLFQRFGC